MWCHILAKIIYVWQFLPRYFNSSFPGSGLCQFLPIRYPFLYTPVGTLCRAFSSLRERLYVAESSDIVPVLAESLQLAFQPLRQCCNSVSTMTAVSR